MRHTLSIAGAAFLGFLAGLLVTSQLPPAHGQPPVGIPFRVEALEEDVAELQEVTPPDPVQPQIDELTSRVEELEEVTPPDPIQPQFDDLVSSVLLLEERVEALEGLGGDG